MTLFGRHEKNINDATTTTGGGVNAITVNDIGTVGFLSAPNVYILNATNKNVSALTTTISNSNIVTTLVSALTITAGGTGFTGNPTLLFYGGGATTAATATCTQAGGAITTVTS
jgi:hypothetical protein